MLNIAPAMSVGDIPAHILWDFRDAIADPTTDAGHEQYLSSTHTSSLLLQEGPGTATAATGGSRDCDHRSCINHFTAQVMYCRGVEDSASGHFLMLLVRNPDVTLVWASGDYQVSPVVA